MIARRLTIFVIFALAAGCASAPARSPAPHAAPAPAPAPAVTPAPAPAPGATSGLEFLVEPGEAVVAVDGVERGSVAEIVAAGGVLPLAPGIYQVSLRSPGFVTWRAEVAVRSSRERIEVKLVKKP